MRKKSSVLLLTLLTSAGLAMAAGNNAGIGDSEDVGLIGPDPTAVSGASSSGAATDRTPDDKGHVSGAGVSSGVPGRDSRSGASGQASGGQGEGAGTAYIDCPGNAFSGGIRNDPEGRDCVPPESLVIQGDENRTRDSMTENLSQGIGSSARGSTSTSNAATQSSGNQGNGLSTGGTTTGAANRTSGDAGTMGTKGTTGIPGTTSTMGATDSTADTGSATGGMGVTGSTGITGRAVGGTGGMSDGAAEGISRMGGSNSDAAGTGNAGSSSGGSAGGSR